MVSHRRPRGPRWWRDPDGSLRRRPLAALLVVGGFLVVTGTALAGAGVLSSDGGARSAGRPVSGGPVEPVASSCQELTILSATSYEPVLTGLAPRLAEATPCVRLRVVTVDGRAAPDALGRERADAWVADDGAWRAMADPALLAAPTQVRPVGDGGNVGDGAEETGDAEETGVVVAISPLYLLTTHADAASVGSERATWHGVAERLAEESAHAERGTRGLRLMAADPARSGAGLVGVGSLAEGVWLAEGEEGMDESTVALTATNGRAITYPGVEAIPVPQRGQVAVVPEYALLPRLAGLPADSTVLTGQDRTALLRYTWWTTARGSADPVRQEALATVLRTLTSAEAAPALHDAGLRPAPTGPGLATSPAPAVGAGGPELPALTAEPFPVLGPHHADHVLAAWNAQDRRADVLVVVDVSGSMADPAAGSWAPLVEVVTSAAQDLTELLPDDATLGAWVFGSRLRGTSDHVQLVAPRELGADHRATVRRALAGVTARPTGTGLYDTVLDAYTHAAKRARAGVPAHVIVFTDGRDEHDRDSIGLAGLERAITALGAGGQGPQLTVIAYGAESDADRLAEAVEPVDGYVEQPHSAAEVRAAFIHAAAGGLDHSAPVR
ncbi:MAG: VWA domain-containing protein [Phycicoccus sp.]